MHHFRDLPFVSAIVGGLFPGRAIVISGLVLQPFASDSRRTTMDSDGLSASSAMFSHTSVLMCRVLIIEFVLDASFRVYSQQL
ncbi:hypothetical protein TELCIR_12049 [Teladorsagia circumcincta]|uniref:Galectin domain-containing protein n=1 Tax=Teladorsagia circumcincta TaxID=45464 RepID=A0A2G9U956_TELCI|nr:hypothetical protein TELCIR_12049 [Teladorsagia circumcincta]